MASMPWPSASLPRFCERKKKRPPPLDLGIFNGCEYDVYKIYKYMGVMKFITCGFYIPITPQIAKPIRLTYINIWGL